jgi:hypothetical protein
MDVIAFPYDLAFDIGGFGARFVGLVIWQGSRQFFPRRRIKIIRDFLQIRQQWSDS